MKIRFLKESFNFKKTGVLFSDESDSGMTCTMTGSRLKLKNSIPSQSYRVILRTENSHGYHNTAYLDLLTEKAYRLNSDEPEVFYEVILANENDMWIGDFDTLEEAQESFETIYKHFLAFCKKGSWTLNFFLAKDFMLFAKWGNLKPHRGGARGSMDYDF